MSKLDLQITARGGNVNARRTGENSYLIDVDNSASTQAALDAASAANAAALAALATIRYTYPANNVDDTAGIRAMIAQAVASGAPAQMTVFGSSRSWLTPGNEYDPTGLAPGSSIRFKGDVNRGWNPADPDGSLGGLFKGSGSETNPCAPGFKIIIEGTHDYSPRLSWQGKIRPGTIDPTNGLVTVDMTPGYEPAFATMDVFHGIVDDKWEYSQFEGRAAGSGTAYPIVRLGDGGYQMQLPSIALTVTGVSMMNPLELIVSGAETGMSVAASGFVGLLTSGGSGPSGLNSISGLTLQTDEDVPNRAIVLKDGAQIDASTWSAYVSGGSLAVPRVPVWAVDNMELLGAVRKRGTAEIDPRFFKDWEFDGTVTQAQGVFFKGRFGSGTLRARIRAKPTGRMVGTAGCLITSEFNGRIDFDIEGVGYGDDKFNVASFKWGPFLTNIAAGTLTVDASKVYPPSVGNMIAFEKGTAREVHPVTAVAITNNLDGTRPAVVTVATPTGIDSTWAITNLATDPQTSGGGTLEGGARGFFFQSSNWRAKPIVARKTRGPIIRHQNPNSSAHPNQGCAKGGGLLAEIKGEDNATDYIDKANGVYVYRMLGAGVDPIPGVKPVLHGPVSQIGYGFTFGLTEGVPVIWPDVTLGDPGTRRAIHPRTIADPTNPGNFDFVAIGGSGSHDIGRLNADALLWVKILTLLGGQVRIGNRGQGLLRLVSDANASIRTLAYGTTIIAVNLTTARNFTLGQMGAQAGDRHIIAYSGTGGSAVVKDEASGASIGTALTATQTGTYIHDGANWGRLL